MMAGLVEFVYRLLNPIEEKNPRMYHYDVTYGQLAMDARIDVHMLSIYHRR